MLKPSRYFAYFRVKKRKRVGKSAGEDRKEVKEKGKKRDRTFKPKTSVDTVNFFIDKIVFRNFLCKPISTFMEPIR